ncbi:MAG: histidinol-phosphate transaminase [Lachnospiraceae bacterium]|nr:histidinol-phosphate transaminase [Lachnospiraceae bacterium]
MSNWEKNVRKVVPYVPGEQPKLTSMIKLNTNENPYPPAPGVAKALASYDVDKERLYPDPTADVLVSALAKYHGIDKENVFVGVGSDDVLSMCFLTFFNGERPILFPDITYSFYDVWAGLYRIPYKTKALDEDFNIVPEDYFEENGGVVFANPNAPTGALMSLEGIRTILEHNRDVVVIADEAYIDFGGDTALPLIREFDNLLVVRTFSKSRSMAGTRIGYAMGDKKIIKYLNDAKFSFNSYTMNRTSLAMGAASVEDEEYFRKTIDRIVATRERVKKELKTLGFTFADSKSNFIFASYKTKKAEDIFTALREENIFVRYFKKPRIDNYLRITIGTDEEMDTLISFLKKYL